ncbi:hypothetical protein ACFZAR_14760 [Streptomyces sp. NPDC008222]|uniref:hypothetical protein n=1 Tax=Streptomyces sp. NPDC008222 TaxID=3364820 RepID=UPI0036E4A8AE
MTALDAEEIARLHRLVALETPAGLSREADTGQVCVWCGHPTDQLAVPMRPVHPEWKACPSCRTVRVNWFSTWYDWHRHAGDCVPCRQRLDVTTLAVPLVWEGQSSPQLGYAHVGRKPGLLRLLRETDVPERGIRPQPG